MKLVTPDAPRPVQAVSIWLGVKQYPAAELTSQQTGLLNEWRGLLDSMTGCGMFWCLSCGRFGYTTGSVPASCTLRFGCEGHMVKVVAAERKL